MSLTNSEFVGISSIKFPEILILFIPTILMHKQSIEMIKTGILLFLTVLPKKLTNEFNQSLFKCFKCFFLGNGKKL